ncbi:MORN repeat variant [Saccharicrinis fermentans DSM 9555 = JCM 21142]|uniref:MORN repeat variant n=2 Tax=Saccharicrinis fermentans TaxID=982 RepID=W7Y210_9BACT|nr:MORN repeat variant [Saccharicrinis fermentans DSM 9555 = JCM 21142]
MNSYKYQNNKSKLFIMRKLFALLVMVMVLSACDFFAPQQASTKKAATNPDGTYIQKKHFNNDPSSPVEWKVSLKKNEKGEVVRHGLSIRYSNAGKVYEKINYVNNKKEGKRYTYHSNGKVWKEQEYKNGRLDGTCKRYDRSGNITAEYFYKGGMVGTGLKEYTNLGKLRDQPTLRIQKVDEIRSINMYRIKASLVGEGADRVKSVEYYEGKLIEGKFFHKNLTICNVNKNKTGVFNYEVPKGAVLDKSFNIVAVATMTSGMKLILQRKVSVSVRGV